MGVKLCQGCREVRFKNGMTWCGLHQQDYPDAVQCARYQPEPGPSVHAESGTGLAWEGIAFTDVAQ